MRRKRNMGRDRDPDIAKNATAPLKITTDAALVAVVRALARVAAEHSLSPLSSVSSGAQSGTED